MGDDGRSVGRGNDGVCKNDGAFGGVTACVGRDEVHGAEACRGAM